MRRLTDLPANNVRLPAKLWELLRLDAKRNQRSLNSHLIIILSALYGLSEEDLQLARLIEEPAQEPAETVPAD